MARDLVARFCRALWTHDERTRAALLARVDPNGADRWGHRPLVMAVEHADLATVTALVARGAAVDQGRVHMTPLAHAARRGAADLVAFLRDAGAADSIVAAVYLGQHARLRRALAKDPALAGLVDEDGTPLVHHAAVSLDVVALRLLLAKGARVDTSAADGGETALHAVANLRRADEEPVRHMVTALLDAGADPDARNWAAVTPLHQAVRARNLGAVAVLLARGADPNARDNRGSTPLRRAVSGTGASATAGTAALMAPLTRLLLAHGADPGARDKRGVPVHESARAPELRALLTSERPTAVQARKRGTRKRSPGERPARKPRAR